MGRSDRFILYRVARWISGGTKALPRASPQKGWASLKQNLHRRKFPLGGWLALSPTIRSGIIGVLFLVFSGGLGLWADQMNQRLSTERWEKAHSPSPKWITRVLSGYGLRPVEEDGLRRRVLRGLPVSLESQGKIWATPDLNWIHAFPYSEEDEASGVTYCRVCSKTPAGWHEIGGGWAGFERVLEALEKQKKEVQHPEIILKKRQKPDPRELVY